MTVYWRRENVLLYHFAHDLTFSFRPGAVVKVFAVVSFFVTTVRPCKGHKVVSGVISVLNDKLYEQVVTSS